MAQHRTNFKIGFTRIRTTTSTVAKILELDGGGNLMDKANLSCSAISCVHSSSFLFFKELPASQATEKAVQGCSYLRDKGVGGNFGKFLL